MKPIQFVFEADGRLHASNANHPHVTTDDMRAVLTGLALVEWDVKRPGVQLATGVTDNLYPTYDIQTVVYRDLGAVLLAITSMPARPQRRRAYLRCILTATKEGLWIPAEPTP